MKFSQYKFPYFKRKTGIYICINAKIICVSFAQQPSAFPFADGLARNVHLVSQIFL